MSDRPIVIKSTPEIETMREAGRVNAAVLKMVKDMIRPGITTQDLDAVAEDYILKNGGKPAFKNYPGPYPYPATPSETVEATIYRASRRPGRRDRW